MPSLKNKEIKISLNIAATLSVVVLIVIAAELFFAYSFWYENIKTHSNAAADESVVKVDITGYRKVIQFLDDLDSFKPDGTASQTGNPFTYR